VPVHFHGECAFITVEAIDRHDALEKSRELIKDDPGIWIAEGLAVTDEPQNGAK
jgi:hypothetical protein